MNSHPPKYAIAWSDGGSLLAGINPSKIMEPGFYLIRFDEQMRESIVGGPYATAEERLQMPLRHLKESWPALDYAFVRLMAHNCVWNLNLLSQGKPMSRRAVRSMLKYPLWVQAYLAAKRCVVRGVEMVDA